MKKRNQFKNRIWIIAASVLVALTTTLNVQAAVLSSVALEQQVRCGLEEHIHTQECYLDELLVCTKKAHTHSENCYLLLLGENNVNALLGSIETAEDNSLDTLIADVVNDAILYEDSALSVVPAASSVAQAWSRSGASSSGGWTFFTSASSSAQAGAASSSAVYAANTDGQVLEADISLLNENIVAANIQPYMVLNTNLTTMALTPEDTEPITTLVLTADDSGGITTYAVEATPDTSNNHANFYIYVVDENGNAEWICIGTTDVTVTYSNWRYTSTATTANAVALFQSAIVPSSTVTANNISAMGLRYSTNSSRIGSSNNYSTPSSVNSSSITFESSIRSSSTANSAKYVWWPDQTFYVVTYKYLSGNETSFYVPAGAEINVESLSSGYVWSGSDGNTYDPNGTTRTITVTASITLTEKANRVTVTYLGGTTTPDSFTLSPGDTHTIDPNGVLPEGYIWIDENGAKVTAGSSIIVNKDTVFRAVPATYANRVGGA